jgi:hypothetical protein
MTTEDFIAAVDGLRTKYLWFGKTLKSAVEIARVNQNPIGAKGIIEGVARDSQALQPILAMLLDATAGDEAFNAVDPLAGSPFVKAT